MEQTDRDWLVTVLIKPRARQLLDELGLQATRSTIRADLDLSGFGDDLSDDELDRAILTAREGVGRPGWLPERAQHCPSTGTSSKIDWSAFDESSRTRLARRLAWSAVAAWLAAGVVLLGSWILALAGVEFSGWPTLVVLVIALLLSLAAAATWRWMAGAAALVLAWCLGSWALGALPWWPLAPEAYFRYHGDDYRAIGELARTGALDSPDYDGSALPPELAARSANGKAAWVVGESAQDGCVLFVPLWTGIPDDAGGYLYVFGDAPASNEIDLYGRLGRLDQAVPLQDGWYLLL